MCIIVVNIVNVQTGKLGIKRTAKFLFRDERLCLKAGFDEVKDELTAIGMHLCI